MRKREARLRGSTSAPSLQFLKSAQQQGVGASLEEFSDTYNGQPPCYVALGAQKNYNAFYLMGAYDGSKGEVAGGSRPVR